MYQTCILACLIATTLGCTAPRDKFAASLLRADSLVAAAVASGSPAGAVLMVSINGEIRHLSAHGFAQQFAFGGALLEQPVPMTPEHVFDLASLTKVFATTFGVMLLVDEGRVGLDEPLKSYLPAFTGASKDSITVRHLLTHTAGLHPWKPVYYHASNEDEAFDYISQLDLAYPVGEARHYSDLGFMLLGYMVASVSGKSLDAFLNDAFYQKLGLHRTGFNPQDLDRKEWAATSHGNPFERRMVADDNFGYVCDEDPASFTQWRERILIGEVNDGNAYHAHNGVAGHAGLFSTAADLQVLLQVLLNKGMFSNQQRISQSVVDAFLTPDKTRNGLGWAMSPDVLLVDALPEGAFGHTGFTGTYALGVPQTGLSVVLLTNRQHGGVDEDGRYPSVNALRKAVVETITQALPPG